MKTALLLLSLALSCSAQVGGGFGVAGLCNHVFGPKPPNLWVDVHQFLLAGASEDAVITSANDYSGHGNLLSPVLYPSLTVSTNFIYKTTVGPAITVSPSGNNCYLYQNRTGYPEFILSNACTIAFRIYWNNGNALDVWVLDGSGSGGGFSQFFVGSTLFFDWPAGGAISRISVTAPGDLQNNWHNIVCTHGHNGVFTNQTIWYDGAPIRSTNNAVGIQGQVLQNIRFFGSMTAAGTKYYIKRLMVWDYVLSTNEIAHLGYWMASQP